MLLQRRIFLKVLYSTALPVYSWFNYMLFGLEKALVLSFKIICSILLRGDLLHAGERHNIRKLVSWTENLNRTWRG